MKIGIIGGGAFGTGLGVVLAQGGRDVTIWMRNAETIAHIQTHHTSPEKLPGVSLPENLVPTHNLEDLVGAAAIFLVLPAQQTAPFLAQYCHVLHKIGAPIISCAKGIDQQSAAFQSEILGRYFPKTQIAVLSGPGFAQEIAAGLPTALTLAAFHETLGSALQEWLSVRPLRLYTSGDVLGVELGGAMKNVIALGCGATIGAGFGSSARSALLTRGFHEMQRLGHALGALPETLVGLSGLGDLVLTATSKSSRNYRTGLTIGQNHRPEQIGTVEGLYTTQALLALAAKHQIELPVTRVINHLILGEMDVKDALDHFLSRPLKREH